MRNNKGATFLTYLTVLVHVAEDRTVLSSKEALHLLLILILHAPMNTMVQMKYDGEYNGYTMSTMVNIMV